MSISGGAIQLGFRKFEKGFSLLYIPGRTYLVCGRLKKLPILMVGFASAAEIACVRYWGFGQQWG